MGLQRLMRKKQLGKWKKVYYAKLQAYLRLVDRFYSLTNFLLNLIMGKPEHLSRKKAIVCQISNVVFTGAQILRRISYAPSTIMLLF